MQKSMPLRAYYSVLLLFLGFEALAQQGHPLTGTWSGDWGSAPDHRTAVTFVLNWDGQKITGIINPGPDSIPLAGASLDLANWTARVSPRTSWPRGSSKRLPLITALSKALGSKAR
jgi:hypothetical protein